MNRETENANRTAGVPRGVIAAGIVVFLGLTVLFGYFAADPFESAQSPGRGPGDFLDRLFADRRAEAEPPRTDNKVASCSVVCEKIVDCGLVPDPTLCVSWCVDEWGEEQTRCIAGAACDKIEEACFEKTEEAVCSNVCVRVSGCDWMKLPVPECVDICLDQWTKQERECLMTSDCDSAPEHCLSEQTRTPCPQVCDKLFSCGQFAQDNFPDCVRMCEEEMDAAERDCVMTYECGEAESICLEGRLPEDMCFEACSAVIDCELAAITETECVQECEDAWSEDLALCIMENQTCEEATECFAEPGVQCPEFCAFLIECGELTEPEYDACVRSCPDDFSDEERQCVMAADCVGVRDCLQASPQVPDRRTECSDACSKMAGCRIIDMIAQLDCVQTCQQSWSDVQLNCVKNGTCQTIGTDCMTQPPR